MFIDPNHMLDTSVTKPQRTRCGPSGAPGGIWADRVAQAPRGVIAIPEDAALVLVDIQRAFERGPWDHWGEGPRNNPDAERVAARLLAEWRWTARPVVHVRHLSP